MRNYVIINGVNSLTIQGLAINILPPISKPPMRTLREEIDGRDGDITTELGYGAYDRTLEIGLYGNYDIDEVIAFFNSKGTIVFSDEDDKYYNFQILDRIDYTKLVKFRTASINIHCQPFKYPLEEEPLEAEYEYVEGEGNNFTLNETSNDLLVLSLKGQTSQTGTPTPDSPIPVNVVSGDNEIDICGKNLFDDSTNNNKWINSSGTIVDTTGANVIKYNCMANDKFTLTATYSTIGGAGTEIIAMAFYDKNDNLLSRQAIGYQTTLTISMTAPANTSYLYAGHYVAEPNTIQLEKGSSSTTYEPYIGNTYPIYLGVENLLDLSSATSVTANTTINGNAITMQQTGIFGTTTWEVSNLQANTQYTLSFELTAKETNYNPYYRVSNTSGTDGYTATSGLGNYFKTITTDSNGKAYFSVRPTSAVSVTGSATIQNVQLEKGSKANSYSPYGTTPIELCKIGTYQDSIYKGVGSNLFDGETEMGSYSTSTGLPEASSTVRRNVNYVNVEPNTTYTFSRNGTTIAARLYYYKTDNTFISTEAKSNGQFTTPNNCYKVNFISDQIVSNYASLSINKGSTALPYEPYGAKDKWLLHKEIGKYDTWETINRTSSYTNTSSYQFALTLPTTSTLRSYALSNYFQNAINNNDNEHIFVGTGLATDYDGLNVFLSKTRATTSEEAKTWLKNNGVVFYYILANPTTTEITDTTLLEQLDEIETAHAYEGQTNITQENNDEPFYIVASTLKQNSDHLIVNNIGNIYSKPILDLEGTGLVDVYLDGTQAFKVDLTDTNEIIINTNEMEAYNPSTNALANRQVVGDYSKFKLEAGENDLKFSGALTKATITNYTRWL